MAYQPNDFVNPYQRGFELPVGCKDLNDVLTRVGKGQFVAPSGVQRGGMSSFRLHLARLYEAKSPRLALVVMGERGALLIHSCVEGRFELTLLLHRGSAFLEEAIVEVF